jgi:hypothetical protein
MAEIIIKLAILSQWDAKLLKSGRFETSQLWLLSSLQPGLCQTLTPKEIQETILQIESLSKEMNQTLLKIIPFGFVEKNKK